MSIYKLLNGGDEVRRKGEGFRANRAPNPRRCGARLDRVNSSSSSFAYKMSNFTELVN